jgi:hypothetical protein
MFKSIYQTVISGGNYKTHFIRAAGSPEVSFFYKTSILNASDNPFSKT